LVEPPSENGRRKLTHVGQREEATRRMHTREFKATVVALVRAGRRVAQVAKDFRWPSSLCTSGVAVEGRRGKAQRALRTRKENFRICVAR